MTETTLLNCDGENCAERVDLPHANDAQYCTVHFDPNSTGKPIRIDLCPLCAAKYVEQLTKYIRMHTEDEE